MTHGTKSETATVNAAAAVPKREARIEVTWAGEHRFDTGRPGGPTARLDGEGVTGQSPVDALLSALAACSAVDVVDILAKRRTPVERLEITVTGERADGTPRRLLAIELSFAIDGAGIDRDHATRAIDLSLNKYCSVRDSLARDIIMTWNLVLNGEPGAPGEARASV